MTGAALRQFILYDKNGIELTLRPPGDVPAASRVYGPGWAEYTQDSMTGSRVVMDQGHHEAHQGKRFSLVSDASTATSLIFAFKAGSTELPHMTLKWKTENAGNIKWHRGAVWTPGTGTDVSPINTLDGSAIESTILGDASGSFVAGNAVLNPTGLSLAGVTTIYEESTWGMSQNPIPVRSERILSKNETYAVSVTCASGGAWLNLEWYEHVE